MGLSPCDGENKANEDSGADFSRSWFPRNLSRPHGSYSKVWVWELSLYIHLKTAVCKLMSSVSRIMCDYGANKTWDA